MLFLNRYNKIFFFSLEFTVEVGLIGKSIQLLLFNYVKP